jgi:hypothetical protein
MKIKVLIIALVCLVLQAKAQTSDTNTMVNDNNSWAILNYGVCPECPVWTQYVYFDGDSIVASNSYKKVFSCDDKLHEKIKYEGLMRKQNKKIYFIPAASETEYLLYDFSLEEGMTFEHHIGLSQETQLLEVKNSDTVEINGFLKKRLQITYSPSSFYDYVIDTWIEDIGSLSGILYPYYGLGLDGVINTLLCYYQNNELKYKNHEYSECYYDKKEDITSVQTIVVNDCSVFPNPIDDILTVFSTNNIISRIEIFDNIGRKIYNQIYKDTINVSSFSKGIYLLKVYDINEQVSVFKIIKK